MSFLIKEQQKAVSVSRPSLTPEEANSAAREIAAKNLKIALKHWCGVSGSAFDTWANISLTSDLTPLAVPSDDDIDEEDVNAIDAGAFNTAVDADAEENEGI